MRAAVFSDMHGNCVALDAVLTNLKDKAIDRMVCLGDAIQSGPQPAQVVRRLRELGCPVVMGNADAWLLTGEETGDEAITSERLQKMNDLLAYHGSPNSFDDVILPDIAQDKLAAYLHGHTADAYRGGHTHVQFLRRIGPGSQVHFNPGSVGFAYSHHQPDEGFQADHWAEYAILTVEDRRLALGFHRVPFDVAALIAIYQQSGRPMQTRPSRSIVASDNGIEHFEYFSMKTARINGNRNSDPPGRAQREHAKLWRDASLDNLELLRAHFVTQTFAPHTHETYAIGIVEGGVEYFDYRGRRELAGAGTIAIIHPGELHTGGPLGTDGWRYCALYPDVDLMERTLAAMGCRHRDLPFFRQPVIDDPELFGQLLRMHAALDADAEAPVLERESRLMWVLAKMIEHHADHAQSVRPIGPERGIVATMVGYLHDNLPRNVRLAELSRLTQLSEFQLLRAFRAEMGLPPHAYLNQLRVARAKSLLVKGVPPADAAAQVGFADQPHLTRRFKRVVGVTPGAVAPDRKPDSTSKI